MPFEATLRPRWGTFSVIDHQRPAKLIPEILLYDRLVFPVPTDVADRKRWADKGWNPELLDARLQELEGLVHATVWTPELREKWSARWQQMQKLGRDTEAIAMGLTPMVLAMSAWTEQVPPPIMIAAYQDQALANKDLALTEHTHEEFIRSSFVKTVKRSVFRVVEVAAGPLVGYATANPLAGAAAGGAMKLVGARLPSMSPEPGDRGAQPGAALHKAISVMFHDA